jgi:SAM-dependent methyltransferase
MFEKWGFEIVRCRSCGVGRTVLPDGFQADSIYDASYFAAGRVDGYADYEGSEKVLRREFRRTLAYLGRFAPAPGRLLEIGCAYGFFLSEAERLYQCVGVELSSSAAAFARARGLDVRQGTLETTSTPLGEPFDAVVMLDVLEHLERPGATLAAARERMSTGAALLLTTGDWSSMLATVCGAGWRLMTPPQHLHFFSPIGLERLLTSSGFELVACDRPWKTVPVGLALFQIASRLGLRMPRWNVIQTLGIRVNLFDVMRVVARKR